MARLRTKTISRRTVEALKVEKDTMFWDSELAGFGVRVYPSGMKVYIAQTRARGKAAQRVTVGEHGVITPEEARRRAALILLRIKAGQEPVPEPLAATLASGPTVADLARHYLEDHVAVRCKAKTEADYRQVIAKHIAPALGRQPALAVDHARVTELHHALRDTPVMANKVVDTLSRIYNAAEDKGRIPEGSNPCRLVMRNREEKRERAGSEVSLGIRPELFKAVATDAVPSGMNALDGRIAGRTFAGNLLHVYVDIDDGTRVVLEARPQDPLGGDGSAIRLGWRPQDSIVLTR